MNVNLTEAAIEQVQTFATNLGVSPQLRIKIVGGGCAGFAYDMELVEETLDTDSVFEFGGVRVLVDGFSLHYLDGATVDYVETLQGAGFVFNNPNVTSKCGCGGSFSA